ncbi:MAG: plasmid replication protein, CyRepA1 family [Halomonas sp.]|nr:plasmid replication protein, CyRepA1 family [Halomonas sp.]
MQSHNDLLSAFRQSIIDADLNPPTNIEADGNKHAFNSTGKRGKKQGTYLLNPITGRGWFKCHRNAHYQTFSVSGAKRATIADVERIKADKAKSEQQQAYTWAKCAESAHKLWSRCSLVSTNQPYLVLKGIDPVGLNLRQHPSNGALVVPMFDPEGRLVNLQSIRPDGEKRFLKNARKHSCYTLIGAGSGQGRIFCEGYATGYTVWKATGKQAVVAFDAGNLKHVVAHMAHDGDIVAADNDNAVKGSDRFGKPLANYGIGHKAALATGLPVYLPSVPGKDFNDLATDKGIEAVRSIFEAAPVSQVPVFDAWGLASVALKGTKPAGWLKTLGKATTPEEAASIARSIMDRMSMATPAGISIARLRQQIEANAPAGLIHPITLDSIAGRVDYITAKYRQPAALQPVSLSSQGKARHRVELVAELPSLTPGDYHGVILVKAPMAAGKTQKIGQPLAAHAIATGITFLSICHRRSLVREMANRLSLTHYGDINAGTSKALATCLPSICRPDHAPLIDRVRMVFIDEVAQALDFLESRVCRTGDATNRDVYDRLRQIVAVAECAVVADAGLNDRVLSFLEQCRPGETFRIIEMLAPAKLGITANFAYGQDIAPSHVIGECLKELANDGRVWIACETKYRARALEELFTQHDPSLRVIAIYADNAGNKRQRDFMANPEAECLAYDVVIASPVISSGISIEHKNIPKHFTLGAFIGNGNSVTPADAAQMLRRVRYLKRYVIGLASNTTVGQQHPNAILKAAETAARIEGKAAPVTDFDTLVADIRASHENARADFAAGLLWQLDASGWHLVRAHEVCNEHLTALRAASESAHQRYIDTLMLAPILSEWEANVLAAHNPRGELQNLTLEAHRIRKALGLERQTLTEEALEFWDDGRAARRLDRFDAFRGIVPDAESAEVPVTMRRYLTACARGYAWLFDGIETGVADWLTPDIAGLIVDRIMQHRHLLAHLGVVPRKFGKFKTNKNGILIPMERPERPVSVVSEVLALMGLAIKGRQVRCHSSQGNTLENSSSTVTPEASKASMKQKGNPRVWVYSITPESYATMQHWTDSRANACAHQLTMQEIAERAAFRRAVKRARINIMDQPQRVLRPYRGAAKWPVVMGSVSTSEVPAETPKWIGTWPTNAEDGLWEANA